MVAAAVLSLLIALCFAEVASRYGSTGGAYLYARDAFGPFVGFEVGWMTCCVGVIGWAAMANALTEALGFFMPQVTTGPLQAVVVIALIALLVTLNVRGVKLGATVSNLFTLAKLIPIVVVIAVGLFFVEANQYRPFAPTGYAKLPETTLLVLYAFVGFEGLVVPAGEMRNPKRSVPLALILVLLIATGAYVALQAVTIGALPDVAGHVNPVAAVGQRIMGPVGGTLVAVGIVVSIIGINAGAALVTPRRVYAMAERGDLPRVVMRLHKKHGTPWVAIVLSGALSAALALTGSFAQLAVISVVARFLQYIPTCIALFVFRRRYDSGPGADGAGFRLPWGPVIPVLALVLCAGLLAQTDVKTLAAGGLGLVIGAPLYFLNRRRNRA
jgi:amino acid transporter